jgi:hypothetical protein
MIITSSVYVNSDLTVLKDPDVREAQYVDSILFYIRSKAIRNIVVCDNSGFDHAKNERLAAEAKKYGKDIEFLSFVGDKDKIKSQGKGYGEGQIMEYTFRASRLLGKEENFFKVTGRVIVLNIDRIASRVKPGHTYFQKMTMNPLNKLYKFNVDTRLYYCSRAFFERHLLDAFTSVDDNGGRYLEHTYYDRMVLDKVRWKEFAVFPRYTGISGSTGLSYSKPLLKWWVQKIIYVLKKNFSH